MRLIRHDTRMPIVSLCVSLYRTFARSNVNLTVSLDYKIGVLDLAAFLVFRHVELHVHVATHVQTRLRAVVRFVSLVP